MGADLGGWKNSDDEYSVRGAVLKALGIEPQSLMFCLSHTHSGPSISRDDAAKTGGNFIAGYLDMLQEAAVNLARKALASSVPAILTWQYGKCSLATNRDLPIGESDRFVVGFNPEGKPDDTVLVGRITNEENNIIGTIVNYACHPTTLAWDNRLISPDYIGAMHTLVEGSTQAPCLFLQGASGELSPAEQYTGDIGIAEKNGRRLGYSVLAVLESMLLPAMELTFDKVVESGAALAAWKQTTYVPRRDISAKIAAVPFPLKPLPSLAEIEQQYQKSDDRVLKERLFRKRGVRKAVGEGDTAQTPLWIWQLGDSFLVGQQNEAYSKFQTELRRQLSPHAVAVMNLVNGGIGYLPPAELYNKDIYQEWQTPFAAGSLELLIKKALEVIEEK